MINRKRLEIIRVLKPILKIRCKSVHWIQPTQCTFQWIDPVKMKINPASSIEDGRLLDKLNDSKLLKR